MSGNDNTESGVVIMDKYDKLIEVMKEQNTTSRGINMLLFIIMVLLIPVTICACWAILNVYRLYQ